MFLSIWQGGKDAVGLVTALCMCVLRIVHVSKHLYLFDGAVCPTLSSVVHLTLSMKDKSC